MPSKTEVAGMAAKAGLDLEQLDILRLAKLYVASRPIRGKSTTSQNQPIAFDIDNFKLPQLVSQSHDLNSNRL